MKLRPAGTVNRLNPPQADPVLMTLRFIDFKTSEPQNIEYRTAESRKMGSLCSVFKINKNR